jgi:hypothetical protein
MTRLHFKVFLPLKSEFLENHLYDYLRILPKGFKKLQKNIL